jgi:hypothetical protein
VRLSLPIKVLFIPRRLITDNAMVEFECLHFIEHNTVADKSSCAYKLDLSKAFRVDWDFLKKVMQRLGFSSLGGLDNFMRHLGEISSKI